jgi:hypothetical protein
MREKDSKLLGAEPISLTTSSILQEMGTIAWSLLNATFAYSEN